MDPNVTPVEWLGIYVKWKLAKSLKETDDSFRDYKVHNRAPWADFFIGIVTLTVISLIVAFLILQFR